MTLDVQSLTDLADRFSLRHLQGLGGVWLPRRQSTNFQSSNFLWSGIFKA